MLTWKNEHMHISCFAHKMESIALNLTSICILPSVRTENETEHMTKIFFLAFFSAVLQGLLIVFTFGPFPTLFPCTFPLLFFSHSPFLNFRSYSYTRHLDLILCKELSQHFEGSLVKLFKNSYLHLPKNEQNTIK